MPSPPLWCSDVSEKVCGHQFISFRAFCLLYPNFGIPGAQIQPMQFGVHFLEGPKEGKPTIFVSSRALRKTVLSWKGPQALCHRGAIISPWELGGSDSRVPYPKGQCWIHFGGSGSHSSSAQLCDLAMNHNLHCSQPVPAALPGGSCRCSWGVAFTPNTKQNCN